MKGEDAYREFLHLLGLHTTGKLDYGEPYPRPELNAHIMQEWYEEKVNRNIEKRRSLDPDLSSELQKEIEQTILEKELLEIADLKKALERKPNLTEYEFKWLSGVSRYLQFLKQRQALLNDEPPSEEDKKYSTAALQKNRRALLFLLMMEEGMLPENLVDQLSGKVGSKEKAYELLGMLLDINSDNLNKYHNSTQGVKDLRKEEHLQSLQDELEELGLEKSDLHKRIESELVKVQQRKTR